MSIKFNPPSLPVAPSLIPINQPVSQAEWEAVRNRQTAANERLRKLMADDEQPLVWNRAYAVDINLPLFSGSAAHGGFPASFGTLNIDNGATFYALGIEAPYQCTGVLNEDLSPATLTIPETLRPLILDYTWTIRDSGTDQDWSSIPVPSAVIRTGNIGMTGIGGHRKLAGGSKVTITVNPTFFDATSTASGLKTFSSQSLQFIISGVAVKDGVTW